MNGAPQSQLVKLEQCAWSYRRGEGKFGVRGGEGGEERGREGGEERGREGPVRITLGP